MPLILSISAERISNKKFVHFNVNSNELDINFMLLRIQNWLIYLFIYLSIAYARMRRCFSQTHTTLATFFMFHSVDQVESAHMQSRHSLYCWFIQDDKHYILTTSLIYWN